MEPSTQESTINPLKELQRTWNLFSQKLSTSSSGKLWSSILVITSQLVNLLMSRNLELLPTTFKLSSQKLPKEILVLRLIFSLRDKKEKNIHHLKPVFVVDPLLQYHLVRYPGKEEISPSISQHSIYQKGFRCIYANPVPVAAAACLGVDIVTDALNTLFLAI